jgi:hypothetical protein
VNSSKKLEKVGETQMGNGKLSNEQKLFLGSHYFYCTKFHRNLGTFHPHRALTAVVAWVEIKQFKTLLILQLWEMIIPKDG